MNKKTRKRTDQISFYFSAEKKSLFIITFTGILYNFGMAAGPWFEGQMVQYLCDIIRKQRPSGQMLFLAISYVLTIGFVQLMRCFKRLYVRKFANNISKHMKLTLFQTMLVQPRSALEDSGSMMTKIISDADACVEGMRKFTTEVFDTGVVMIAYFMMLFSYDWRLTLLSLLFPPIAYILAEKLKVIVTKTIAQSRESSAQLNSATLERIQNALTYRIYGQETNQNKRYETVLADYEKKAIHAAIWENAMQPIYQVISMLGTIMIIWFGSKNVLGTGWTVWNAAAFTTFFSCYKKLAVKSSKAAKLFNAVQKAQVSWIRIRPYLAGAAETTALPEFTPSSLCVKDVSFAYPGQPPLFSDVSFDARPGEIIGITGEIACGKSSFGKLFCGELPYQGTISMNGLILPNTGTSYETRIGYLGHQPELFSGTIEENICLGKPGDLRSVLRTVCIDQEIEELPDGIHTVIGSSGVRLSGGQQARIALARTIYHKKALIILDDPFSAVDFQTEQQIFSNLREQLTYCIILLISHRLELFPQMDQILWMDQNTILASHHETLMSTNEHYRLLFTAQQKEESAQ